LPRTNQGAPCLGRSVVRAAGRRYLRPDGQRVVHQTGLRVPHRMAFYDVTRGSNAWFIPEPKVVCGDSYLCVARKGYDAPTGLGTPDGIGAF
jgi:hypothetical protein